MENKQIKVAAVAAAEVEAKTNGVEINTHEGELNQTEFTIEFQKSGYGYCTPVIDGEPCKILSFGYVTESDKKACEKLIRQALKATGGNVYTAVDYIKHAGMTTEAGITPSKEVEVEGVKFMISYESKKIYTLSNEEVANLEELGEIELPEEAIDALLINKAKVVVLKEREEKAMLDALYEDDFKDDYEDEDYEDEDYGY